MHACIQCSQSVKLLIFSFNSFLYNVFSQFLQESEDEASFLIKLKQILVKNGAV